MECNNQCRFCSIFDGAYNFEKVDRPIFETEKFALIATIGALVEGWVLIVPKEHCYSMKEFYGDNDFNSFVNKVIKILKKVYSKNVIAFEHGANSYNSMTSCGTNHAHLHLLPFNESLIGDMKAECNWDNINFNEKLFVDNDDEYLLYNEFNDNPEGNNTYLHILSEAKSQYFRMLIAKKINRPEEYNYKEHLLLDIAQKTYEQLSAEVLKYE